MKPELLTEVDDLGWTKYHHECGKTWTEKQGDYAPNFCPGCGAELSKPNDLYRNRS